MATSSFKGIVVVKSKKALKNLEKSEKNASSIKAHSLNLKEEEKKGEKVLKSYFNRYQK